MSMLGRKCAAIAGLTSRRLRRSLGLVFASVVASAALVGIWVGVPLYAESATSSLLTTQVDEADADSVPFGYLFSFNRLSGGNQKWTALRPVDEYLSGQDAPFGSTVSAYRQFAETVPFDLFRAADAEDGQLGRVGFSTVTDFSDGVVVVAGRTPNVSADGIEAMISELFANELDLNVGDELSVVGVQPAGVEVAPSVSVRVTGIWSAPDGQPRPEDRFLHSGPMRSSLVISEEDFSTEIAELGDEIVSNAQWLVLLDSRLVTTDTVDDLLAQTNGVNRAVDGRLSGTRLLISPQNSLVGFQDQVHRVNSGLAAFSIPTLALVVFVVGLLASMAWARRSTETDLLRRRGVSANLVVASAAVEAAIVVFFAALIGVGLAFVIATLMAQTSTFLNLGGGVELNFVFTSRARRALLGVAVVVIVLQMLPSLGVYRWSSRAQSRRPETRDTAPWWQRTYLDLAVILATVAFAWFVLRSSAVQGDLLDDPVVILLPAAISVAVGLAVLRLFPPVLERISRVLERTNSTSLLLVVRRAARVSGPLAAPLMLLVVTGALSVYTASMARTLDLQLLDRAYHEVGGENSVLADGTALGSVFDLVNGRPVLARGGAGPPIDAAVYDRVWGLESATRIAQMPARAEGIGGGASIPIELTAIDPSTFADTAFWRDDYATQPLPELLNRLTSTPDAILMQRRVLQANGLRIGDVVDVSATVGDRGVSIPMVIVGSIDQFPTWTPANELVPAVVVLGDLEARVGSSVSRRIIFTPDETAIDSAQTRADLNRLGLSTTRVDSASEVVAQAQQRPERQGIFGLLTVSFVLSSLLTLAAFVFYAAFGFTQQLTEVGTLRALGLRLRSLFVLVGCDLLLVALVGTGVAVLTGAAMAQSVLPRLVGTPAGSAPVLLQETDWAATILIAVVLVVAFLVVTALLLAGLRRIRLFEAIKLGAS